MDARYIGTCAELACLLEVSAPKPGNVSRLRDFADTRYEHFLASAVVLGGVCEDAASRGLEIRKGSLDMEEAGLGNLIKEAVLETKRWHRGRNTNLGITLLLVPLAAGAGMAAVKGSRSIRNATDDLIKCSTPADAKAIYEAIREAAPGGLGKTVEMDVNSDDSIKNIFKKNLNIYKIMKITENDSIAEELINKYKITFEMGYKSINSYYENNKSIMDSIIFTYLNILSQVPDTLIVRKAGLEMADEVSRRAGEILDAGLDPDLLSKFDEFLRKESNRLNPGTTADLTASSLMAVLLEGAIRP